MRLIFKLYRSGDGTSGPLGIKQVTCWLNERGYRTRKGARFGVATVHGILTNTVYIGEWVFNKREAKTLAQKPASEHIVVEVPAIIPRDEFDAVQARMKVNAPMTTPPRVVTGPILLTGLATCATCSGAMTLRTGTSKSGQVHRYYSCSVHGRMGKTACKGRAIRMDRLDTLVTDHLVDHLFQPERLTVMLAGLAAGRAERALEVDTRITTLQTEASQAEDRLKRLYKMVEDGVTDLDDLLRERIAALKLERDRATAALERIKAQAVPPTTLEPEAIERFGRLMRESVTSGDIPFRKAYIQSVVDRVEVDDDLVRIIGDKTTLEQAVAGNAARNLGVRSFERKWRATIVTSQIPVDHWYEIIGNPTIADRRYRPTPSAPPASPARTGSTARCSQALSLASPSGDIRPDEEAWLESKSSICSRSRVIEMCGRSTIVMAAASGSIVQAGTRNVQSSSSRKVRCRLPSWSWSAVTIARRRKSGWNG